MKNFVLISALVLLSLQNSAHGKKLPSYLQPKVSESELKFRKEHEKELLALANEIRDSALNKREAVFLRLSKGGLFCNDTPVSMSNVAADLRNKDSYAYKFLFATEGVGGLANPVRPVGAANFFTDHKDTKVQLSYDNTHPREASIRYVAKDTEKSVIFHLAWRNNAWIFSDSGWFCNDV